MAETEILHAMGSSTTTDQNYVPIRTVQSSTSLTLFNKREALIFLGIASAIYLLTGPYANAVCNLLTSLPMVFFSYKILTANNISIPGYKSVVLYWSIFGLLTIVDTVCSESIGYYVIKCCALFAMSYHVAQSNLEVFREITGTNVESVHDYIRTISPIFDTQSYPLASPEPTTAGDSCSYMDQYYNEMATALSIRDTVQRSEMMSTQGNSPTESATEESAKVIWTGRQCHGIDRVLTPYPEHVEADFAEFNQERIMAGREVSNFSIQPEDSLANVQLTESKCTVAMAFGDIITNPISLVELLPKVSKMVTVVNIAGENIMWALKCNALHRLGASPACGVIASGATVTIRLLHHGQHTNGQEDKLAIDYALVESTREYSPSFVHRTDKKRHLLRIAYKQK